MKKLLRAIGFGGKGPAQAAASVTQPAPLPAGKKRINLALQGGGAHGAFTWGVLDQILADGRLSIEGVSGASAGAMNAIMLADGLARGGPEDARKRLADFWKAASFGGNLPAAQRAVIARMLSFTPLDNSPVSDWFGALAQYWSPYDFNPLNINPLKDVIESFVDFDAVRAYENLQLFVSATNVQTGHLRIFSREKMSADVIMASACLPMLFRAVEIDGVPYWDGGYLGNPVIFPFFRTTAAEDVLIVQINPVKRAVNPTSSREIVNRLNEITFNASLLTELRAIDFVGRLIESGHIPHGTGEGEYRHIRAHRIALDRYGDHLSAGSKLSTDFDFFETLHLSGKRAARRFLDAHFDDLGVRSTFDLAAEAQAEWA